MSEPAFEPTLRLHPLSWLFVLVASIRQFIVPVIAVLVFGARDDGSMWGLIVVVPLVVAALWRQMLFRYGFGPQGLVIRDGLLFRNVRQIEYERIENVDTEHGPLHRLLNVAEVRVETSTGGKPEGLIRVLGEDAVAELRARIFERHQGAVGVTATKAAEPSIETLLKLDLPELMRFGFIDNRGMVVVAAAFGALSQMGALNAIGEYLRASVFDVSTKAAGLSLALVSVGILATLFLIVRLLSLAWAVVMLHDFTLTRQATDLRVRYGLLTRVALTARISRIQAVHRTQSVMHRFFGRVSLAVDLAGDGAHQRDADGGAKLRMRWLAPVCTPRHATELIGVALPSLALADAPRWQALAPGARGRIFRKHLVFWTILAGAPAVYLFEWFAGCVWLAIVPLCWAHASQYMRYTAWSLTGDALWFRRGWLTRRLSIVPRNRIQSVRVSASPFDRRKHMASLTVDTAGGASSTSIVRVDYLPELAAADLGGALYRSITDPFPRTNSAQLV